MGEAETYIRFNSRSESVNILDALEIAKRNTSETKRQAKRELCYVYFDGLTKDFINLAKLVGSLKGSKVVLDGEEISRRELNKIKGMDDCHYKGECNGICLYVRIGKTRLYQVLKSMIRISDGIGYIS